MLLKDLLAVVKAAGVHDFEGQSDDAGRVKFTFNYTGEEISNAVGQLATHVAPAKVLSMVAEEPRKENPTMAEIATAMREGTAQFARKESDIELAMSLSRNPQEIYSGPATESNYTYDKETEIERGTDE